MIVGRKAVETAKGPAELDETFAILEMKAKKAVTPILVSKDLKDVLIGVLSFEAFSITNKLSD
jgi:hypothetical protein